MPHENLYKFNLCKLSSCLAPLVLQICVLFPLVIEFIAVCELYVCSW